MHDFTHLATLVNRDVKYIEKNLHAFLGTTLTRTGGFNEPRRKYQIKPFIKLLEINFKIDA